MAETWYRRYAPDAVEERQRRAVLSAEIAAKIAEYDDQLDGDFDDDDIDRGELTSMTAFPYNLSTHVLNKGYP